MSVNAIIIQALKPLGYPCKPDLYTGKEARYFTFNYADDRGADYGDNHPGCNVCSMQIHYILPLGEDYLREKQDIRNRLHQAGFSYPAVTIFTETESMKRHIVFECDIEEREE